MGKLVCSGCGKKFEEEDFEEYDVDYDEEANLCPECMEEAEITGRICDECDENPAVISVGSKALCAECAEEYANSMSRDD